MVSGVWAMMKRDVGYPIQGDMMPGRVLMDKDLRIGFGVELSS